EQVSHTVTIQRGDLADLSEEELDDLRDFGEQLIDALQQSERIILLQSALDHMTDPVAIIDSDVKLRYANTALQRVFDLTPQMTEAGQKAIQAEPADGVLTGALASRIIDMLKQSLTADEGTPAEAPTESISTGLGKDTSYYGQISIGNIRNSRKRVIGS